MKIITNNQWRPLRYRSEVPTEILKDQFDYQNEEDVLDGFFCYRGYWYHLDEFLAGEDLHPWQGVKSDSYFSGVLIRLSEDGEAVRIARYLV